jgi:hypothetical protein
MGQEILSQDQIDGLGEKIRLYSQLFPTLPIKGEVWEALVADVLKAPWNPNNHNPNQDMVTQIQFMERPSLKSGTIDQNWLTISSHRTTKYETLREKIEFFKTRQHDSYLCLSRPKNTVSIHSYSLIHFPKTVVTWDDINWVEKYKSDGKHIGYEGSNSNGTIRTRIVFSMSHQLWIDLDISLINILSTYDF